MRERITIAFVVLAMAVLLGAGTVRASNLSDLLREQEGAHLSHDVALIGELVANQRASGQPVDQEFLEGVVSETARLEYTDPSGRTVVVEGDEYAGDPDTEDISASASTDVGMITVSKQPKVIGDILGRDTGSLITLFLLIALLAGVAGWIAARALASPFQTAGRRRRGPRPRTVRPGPPEDAGAGGGGHRQGAAGQRDPAGVAAEPGARLRRARVPCAEDPADLASVSSSKS